MYFVYSSNMLLCWPYLYQREHALLSEPSIVPDRCLWRHNNVYFYLEEKQPVNSPCGVQPLFACYFCQLSTCDEMNTRPTSVMSHVGFLPCVGWLHRLENSTFQQPQVTRGSHSPASKAHGTKCEMKQAWGLVTKLEHSGRILHTIGL